MNQVTKYTKDDSRKTYNVILLGFGSVGRHFIKLLLKNNGKLPSLNIVGISDSSGGICNLSGGMPLEDVLKWKEGGKRLNKYCVDSKSIKHFSNSEELCLKVPCDILLDATPVNLKTGGESLNCIRRALSKGTHIVLANKAPLVLGYQELMNIAALEPFSHIFFSATVCGGLPVVNVGRRDLGCAKIRTIRGIFNSTSNFILSQMEKGKNRDESLQIAIDRGIAETDPSLDIEGIDTANKLTIIANSVLGYNASLADVSVKGIADLKILEVEEAKKMGEVIRLIATATLVESNNDDALLSSGLSSIDIYNLSVSPQRVKMNSFLANCRDSDMCVIFESSEFETISMKTNETGVYPTAAAMIRDCSHIIKSLLKK